MKIATIAMAALLLGMVPVMAEDVTTTDVDAQIEEIQRAPAQERYRLMNQFKRQLAEMNEEERAAAIAKLQEQTQDQSRDRIRTEERLHEGSGDRIRAQERMQERQMLQTQQMDQMQQTQQMNRMQNMNQMQGGAGTQQGGMQQQGR